VVVFPSGAAGQLPVQPFPPAARAAAHDVSGPVLPGSFSCGSPIAAPLDPFSAAWSCRSLDPAVAVLRAYELVVAIRRPPLAWWRALDRVRHLGWGVADQAVSSVTNVAMVLYVAHRVGAAQFGAFSLAYVTYAFALNASRGLTSDPLMVRFSGADLPTWRRAVASCNGTTVVVGLVTGAGVVAVAMLLSGAVRFAFLALGLTLPGLMLQDSWRFAFFAAGRGGQAFLNDSIWALALLPALISLRAVGARNVFWFVFAWGAAAGVAAAAGLLQARVAPKLSGSRAWLSQHRDLGFRYLAANTSNSLASQLRVDGLGVIAGLVAVGYVQAAATLLGPVMVLLMGMTIVGIPEAVRIVRQSPQRLLIFCLLVSGGLAVAAVVWGAVLLVALPRGLGTLLLGPIWRPAYPLVLPYTFSIIGVCAWCGPDVGLRALGAARRSLRAMVLASAAGLAGGLAGAFQGGALGSVRGFAVATWFGALLWWWELRAATRESDMVPIGDRHAEQNQNPTTELVSFEPPSGRARVPMSPNGSASYDLPTTPWSTQVTWTVVVGTDRTYYERIRTARSLYGLPVVFPEYSSEQRFVLAGKQMRIGRCGAAWDLELDIDLAATSADPAISRLHAILIAAPDGSWAVLDRGSANGTLLNGRKLAAGDLAPLHDGDRINLGAWTVITVRRSWQSLSPVS
jgi:O-antigen/teichoic acid export membrane protein